MNFENSKVAQDIKTEYLKKYEQMDPRKKLKRQAHVNTDEKMDLMAVVNMQKQADDEAGLSGGKVYKRGDIIRNKFVNYHLKGF